VQAPKSDQTPFEQVRVCVPQLPQGCVGDPAHVWPEQVSHWQAELQVCVPPIPQACVEPGAQVPWFMHGPNSDQTPFVQVRDWVPQLPQAWLLAPLQFWPPHDPHWQAGVHICVPAIPQACIEPGAQAPSPMQADQADQTPLSQVRDCVPQLPQAWVPGPTQLWPVQLPHWQVEVQVWVPFMPQPWLAPGWQPTALQVPTAPATVQLSQVPPQGRSQQTPPAQLRPAWQSLLSRQAWPLLAWPHLPAMHLVGAWHMGEGPSPTQALLQLAPSALQVNGAQANDAPARQTQAPSQVEGSVLTPPAQVCGAQMLPAAYLRHPPVPLQLPSFPQLET